MTLQELQQQALQLPISDRWQLVQTLLESLKRETQPTLQQKNLSRLRGIAKSSVTVSDTDFEDERHQNQPISEKESRLFTIEMTVDHH